MSKSGSGTRDVAVSVSELFPYLAWLESHFVQRETVSNFDSPNDQEQHQQNQQQQKQQQQSQHQHQQKEQQQEDIETILSEFSQEGSAEVDNNEDSFYSQASDAPTDLSSNATEVVSSVTGREPYRKRTRYI